MRDLLLELSANTYAKSAIKALSLPVPLPPVLRRDTGVEFAAQQTPFNAHPVAVRLSKSVGPAIIESLLKAGVHPYMWEGLPKETPWDELSRRYHKPIQRLNPLDQNQKYKALIFDATDLADSQDLALIYAFFHPLMRQIAANGRVIIIGSHSDDIKTPTQAGTQKALDGFFKSISKEVGKKGITVQLLRLQSGAESWLSGPLHFFLSGRSAFITNQTLTITKPKKTRKRTLAIDKPLEGRKILLTGCAQGIGYKSARIFADQGAFVIGVDLPNQKEMLQKLKDQIGGDFIAADLAQKHTSEMIATTLSNTYGTIDAVVHNAGITRDRTLAKMKQKNWDLCLNVNLFAVQDLTDELLSRHILTNYGKILCLSSIAGISGNRGQSNYASAKAGLIGYTQALAKDKNLLKKGITVNALAPGFIETRMTAAIPLAVREVARRLNILSQGGKPEDIGEALAFLLSDEASGMNGQVLRICGGMFMGA